ncbi:protein-tyrosine-phosphatase [Pseudonocardia alni]|uniref:arsenate reductase/protein-tyrosine-phosphatase family protein n=1 Tax=Pseudonocardia alni TaxID=33907 RepID=UPI001AD6CCFD|nr:protein-tyrosine-phosphatase [Pseudonocardia alni]
MTSLDERAEAHERVPMPPRSFPTGSTARRPQVPAQPGADDRFRILIVCTGNICRSPAAELLLRSLLVGRLGGREAARAEVSSAGVAAVVGSGMHPLSRAELAPWGLDARAEGFRARQLDDRTVARADLVLGAGVRHRSTVLERHPYLLDRTFALREFARLVEASDTAVLPTDLVERGRGLVGLARAARGTVPPADDTVPDPMGGPEAAHHDAVRRIFAAVHTIVGELAPRPAGARVQ